MARPRTAPGGQHRPADPADPAGPDSTAVRVALWRAQHVELDPPPHVLTDHIGLALADPPDGWRRRPDMDPRRTARARASIVARARYIEDLVAERAAAGVRQYVLLGAGLDTFAQRHAELLTTLEVFEIDQPATQAWKQRRLAALGLPTPPSLHVVPVDFERRDGPSWPEALRTAGFDAAGAAVVAATGVLLYLSADAVTALFARLAQLAPGSMAAPTFMVPIELVEPAERPARRATERGAEANGTPFRSLFTPEQALGLARGAGLADVRHVPPAELAERYFAGRRDGLKPSSSEHLLLLTT